MAKKILKTLTNNLGFKILAVIMAGLLWLVVYNLDDPNKTKNFSTNVTVLNSDVLTDMNKCYEVLDGTNSITFSVTAKRSYLNNLQDTNFTAVADFKNIIMDEEQNTATVPIEITSNNYNRYITINGKPRYLKLSLDDLMAKQFVVLADTRGEVAENCALGEVTVSNPTVIKVSGPKMIVSKIEKAVATVDVGDMSVSFSDNIVPTLYDKNDNEVDTTRLTLSSPTVMVEVKIVGTKDVALEFATSGTPAKDYFVTGVAADLEKITIKGPSSVLNPISSITIPEKVLNVDGASADIETTIDITEYLPDGVELVDSAQRTITVTVSIEGYITTSFEVPSTNFRIEGVPEGLHAEFFYKNITVEVKGLKDVMDMLNVNDISGVVDASSLDAGVHKVRVEIELSEDYKVSRCRTNIVLTDISDAPVTGAGNGQNNPPAGGSAGTTDTDGGSGGDNSPGDPGTGE